VVPAAVIGLSLASLFLVTVLDLGRAEWLRFGLAAAIAYLVAIVAFAVALAPWARSVESAVDAGADPSAAVSRCLHVTEVASLALWLGVSLMIAVGATALLAPTLRGFQLFVEAALIVATPAMAWSYWGGKHLLLRVAEEFPALRYQGYFASYRLKIAMVFLGFFIVSTGALVQLISAKAARVIADYALTSEEIRFQQLLDRADAPGVTAASLTTDLTMGQAVHLIDSDGTVQSSSGKVSAEEVAAIRDAIAGSIEAGDREGVIPFAPLSDGRILALFIPTPVGELMSEIETYALVVAILSALIFFAAMWFLARDLMNPVRALIGLSEEMSVGDFSSTSHVFSDDDIGRLAASLTSTRENLRHLIRKVGESGVSITRGVTSMDQGTRDLSGGAAEQSQLTEQSNNALDEVRGGARSVLQAADKVASSTQDAASRATELNASAGEVARSMDHLFQSVENISSSTSEIDVAATEMTKRTEFLSRVAEETLAFVSQMDATVRQFEETSHATSSMSSDMLEAATMGSGSVAETVEGIRRAQEATRRTSELLENLEKSIGEIDLVLSVIDELAEKTNLLSLNAAIIAAQAGEHEFGFSVVADEIRDLAERTRKSTREIGKIIKAIRPAKDRAVAAMKDGVEQVDRTVALVTSAADALSRIRENADRTHSMANRTSAALQHHGDASRRLLEMASRMSDDLTVIYRGTSDQSSATGYLASETEKVREIALMVRNATEQESNSARGIMEAMEQIASDETNIRKLLGAQLQSTENIASSSSVLLEIARRNDRIAAEFATMLRSLAENGRGFDEELQRFRFSRDS